jgi:hypothetical protein
MCLGSLLRELRHKNDNIKLGTSSIVRYSEERKHITAGGMYQRLTPSELADISV